MFFDVDVRPRSIGAFVAEVVHKQANAVDILGALVVLVMERGEAGPILCLVADMTVESRM